MNISIKTLEEIKKMRIAGKLAAEVLEMITPHVLPGISTEKLDQLCNEYHRTTDETLQKKRKETKRPKTN
jgi:methionyl aminopeptidase